MATVKTRPDSGRGNPLIMGIVALIVVAGVLAAIAVLFDWFGTEGEPPVGQLGAAPGEVLDNPDEYRDDVVTVSGEVNQVFDPLAFTIGGEDFVNGRELLVIGPAPIVGDDFGDDEVEIAERDIVQVSGSVRDYDMDAVESEIEAEVDTEIPEEFQNQPLLLADGSVISQRVQPEQGYYVDIEEVMDDPESHMDEPVTIDSEVTDTYADVGFVLDGQLLVLDSTETLTQDALESAEEVQVSGDIEWFEIDSANQGTDVDLTGEELEQYEGEPVLIATAVLLLPDTED